MVDLEVYREAGRVLLAGGDFYALPGRLQFLYPPLAAVLSVPLALLPTTLVQVAWTVGGSWPCSRCCTASGCTAGC